MLATQSATSEILEICGIWPVMDKFGLVAWH